MEGDKIMDDSINLNSYKDSFNVPKREYSQLGGARSNKTRFSYRTADDGENLFGIEMCTIMVVMVVLMVAAVVFM